MLYYLRNSQDGLMGLEYNNNTYLTVASTGIMSVGATYSLPKPTNMQEGRSTPISGMAARSRLSFNLKDGSQTRFFDYRGNASLDIDFTNHGFSNHANPHFHTWDFNQKIPRSDFINRW